MRDKILVVDDEKDLRDALGEILRINGFEVLEAKDGSECIEIALREKPDLILLDIMMPGMDGHAVLRELRKDPWGKDVKVIMLTVMSDAGHISKAVERGGDDYLIKTNWSLKDIVKKVKQTLANY